MMIITFKSNFINMFEENEILIETFKTNENMETIDIDKIIEDIKIEFYVDNVEIMSINS